MGGSSAPKPDKNIGLAAMESAQTGREMLGWMQERAKTTDRWANEDRARYQDTFRPLENQMVQEAKTWDSTGRRATRADQAGADVRIAAGNQQAAAERRAASMGVDPRSGRYQASTAGAALDTGLAEAGARNLARRTVEQEGQQKLGAAVNMGRGFAVNPATSYGMGTSAVQSGFSGKMGGLGQQGQMLSNQHQGQMQAWQANNQQMSALGGAAGQLAGAFMFSSKEFKENKRKGRSPLRQLEEMPVEEWNYKGDPTGRRHTGAYAEDFQKATGKGDGKTIPVVDAIGVTMGAVQELAKDVKAIKRGRGVRPSQAAAA